MAVQVTGFFQNPQSGLIYESPILALIPHLEYPGIINMDVRIFATGSSGASGAVGYTNVDKSTLVYPDPTISPYDDLIYALETYVIDNLKDANPINSGSTFERYTPPTGSLI
jgi:hypothetical protein